MKKIVISIAIFIELISIIKADYLITRGPAIGEIYFMDRTEGGIYRSTDYGRTAQLMDNTQYGTSIVADKNPGHLYYYSYNYELMYSSDYGHQGSWTWRPGAECTQDFKSGVTNGEIYPRAGRFSNDYGVTFIDLELNGGVGHIKAFEIGYEAGVGYNIQENTDQPGTMWFFISYNNFNDLEIQHVFDWYFGTLRLSRGTEPGELYLLKRLGGPFYEVLYTDDYGVSWDSLNAFPGTFFTGGRQQGEVYCIAIYMQQLYPDIHHVFIHHSLDYGQSWETFHPIARGYCADFSADVTSGNAPLTVQFTDETPAQYKNHWEWDFNSDGIIDSYEQNPTYTFRDSVEYDVSFLVQYGPVRDSVTKENFIKITGIGINDEQSIVKDNPVSLYNYPNPFNPETSIYYYFPPGICNGEIYIFNAKGELIKNFEVFSRYGNITWDGCNSNNEIQTSGIYFYQLKTENLVLKSSKMILLK